MAIVESIYNLQLSVDLNRRGIVDENRLSFNVEDGIKILTYIRTKKLNTLHPFLQAIVKNGAIKYRLICSISKCIDQDKQNTIAATKEKRMDIDKYVKCERHASRPETTVWREISVV